MLCSDSKTYTLRSVVLSNCVLVLTPPSDTKVGEIAPSDADVVIRDQMHEVLEVVPTLPRLQKLEGLLRGREYDEGHERDEEDEMDVDGEDETDRLVRVLCILMAVAVC